MHEKEYNNRLKHELDKKKKIEKEFEDTHNKIIETIKTRRKFEMSYMDIIKKQKQYWESQLNKTDPKKDKIRYKELKENIERENDLIGQIKKELDRIDAELKQEKEHKQMFKRHQEKEY